MESSIIELELLDFKNISNSEQCKTSFKVSFLGSKHQWPYFAQNSQEEILKIEDIPGREKNIGLW